MAAPPFAGRRPVMIGDDHTDIAAMQACAARGGFGFTVAGDCFCAGEADFPGPDAVRAWLMALLAILPRSERRDP
jgi:trehalose 6-phosphate phosphatase